MSEESTEAIKSMLRKQNEKMEFHAKQMEYLIWHVKGNEEMKIKGIGPALDDLQTEMHAFKLWKESLWKIDLKNLVTRQTINTLTKIFIYALGIGSGSFGVFELLHTIVNP
jgi:hypothetical protein